MPRRQPSRQQPTLPELVKLSLSTAITTLGAQLKLISGNIAQKGDGLAVSEEKFIKLDALSDAELLIIEVPGKEDAR